MAEMRVYAKGLTDDARGQRDSACGWKSIMVSGFAIVGILMGLLLTGFCGDGDQSTIHPLAGYVLCTSCDFQFKHIHPLNHVDVE